MTSPGPDRDDDTCPRCGGRTIPIAYGYPGPGMFEAADRGEIALGGCCIDAEDPTRRCTACGESSGSRT